MNVSEKKFDDTLQIVCDALFSITDEGNHSILEVTATPNSDSYQVNIYPNRSKSYDDDDTRDK